MKPFVALLLMMLASPLLFCQSFKGGLMAGLSTTQVDGDTYSGYNRFGIIGGAYVGLDLSPKFAWQLEMKFFQKGSYKKQNQNAGDFTTYNLRLNYIEMPFLIKYKFKTKFNFEAGLSLGYLAGVKEGNEDGPYPSNLLIPFHKAELSYLFGVYYQLFKKLSFNVRYEYSVLPIREHINGERWILFQRGQFNNVIGFSFYYQINKPE